MRVIRFLVNGNGEKGMLITERGRKRIKISTASNSEMYL